MTESPIESADAADESPSTPEDCCSSPSTATPAALAAAQLLRGGFGAEEDEAPSEDRSDMVAPAFPLSPVKCTAVAGPSSTMTAVGASESDPSREDFGLAPCTNGDYVMGCSVCGGARSTEPQEEKARCDVCSSLTHYSCAGLHEPPTGAFYCSPMCLWTATIVPNPFFDASLSQELQKCVDEGRLPRLEALELYFEQSALTHPMLSPCNGEWTMRDQHFLLELTSPHSMALMLQYLNAPIGAYVVIPSPRLVAQQVARLRHDGQAATRVPHKHSAKRLLAEQYERWMTCPQLYIV